MGGITRLNGTAAVPSQRPSTISFFNISFAASVANDVGVVDGALDKIFRFAVPTVAVVAMIGTVQDNGSGTGRDIRFAIEDTGADANSPSALGGTPDNSVTTANALQAAIRALGTVNGKALGSATVTAFTL